jgi:hypothetical protein
MGPASGNEDMIARTQSALTFALDPQAGRTSEEQDPFVVILAIGLIDRRELPSRDDALDPHAFSREYFGKDLRVRANRKVIEKIAHEPGV